MLPIVHHPDYVAPLRPGHRFPMSKYGYLREALARRGLLGLDRGLSPGPAGAAQISLAHDPGYVERVFALALTAAEVRRTGLPQNEAGAAAGTTLAAWLAIVPGPTTTSVQSPPGRDSTDVWPPISVVRLTAPS